MAHGDPVQAARVVGGLAGGRGQGCEEDDGGPVGHPGRAWGNDPPSMSCGRAASNRRLTPFIHGNSFCEPYLSE
jgi:hypothetical protein